jgi:outer membrane lipoprotein-sorting protein
MNCLPTEQLVTLALGDLQTDRPDELAAARDHVRHCPMCVSALARVEEDLGRVAAAHTWFERGHAAARDRLLAALPTMTVEAGRAVRVPTNRFRTMREAFTKRRMWVGGAAAAALAVIGLLLAWHAAGSQSVVAQTAEALRKVKSYQCRYSGIEAGADEGKRQEVGVVYWAAPGSYRMDFHDRGKLVKAVIGIRGKPGLEIDHKYETYQRLQPFYQPDSPLELLHELPKFAGKADRELPERKIKGKGARGFEIAVEKLDPDRDDGTLRVWPDPETKLPLRVEYVVPDQFTVVWDDFTWDVPTDQLFDTKPPAKYQDETPTPPSPEEQTEPIVKGLKTYAKYYCGGKYPQARIVYGDITSQRLYRAAGLSDPSKVAPREEQLRDEYRECSVAKFGFAHMNTIQRHNPDAAYYGKTVGPDDKDKVLFRWQLEDGGYRVIFGDLRAETVTAQKLKELEMR